LEVAELPSISPSGLTNDTAGSVPLATAVKKSVASFMCSERCVEFPMIDDA